jgi:hypothetical protein
MDLRGRVPLNLILVRNVDSVCAHRGNTLIETRRNLALEPACRAPGVLRSDEHQAVLYRVLVDIVQPGEIGTLESQKCVPVLEPDLSASRPVLRIEYLRGFGMQLPDEVTERPRVFRRAGDEVVVIREDGLRLQ